MFVVLWSIINSLLVFDYVYHHSRRSGRRKRGRGHLLWKQAFERFEAGYAAAMALSLSFVSGLVVLIFIFLRRRGWEV